MEWIRQELSNGHWRIAIVIAFVLSLFGITTAQTPNPLYDTTKAGHNIRRVIDYDYSTDGSQASSRKYLRQVLRSLAIKYGFQLDTSSTLSVITEPYLAGAQILITAYGDGNVLIPAYAQTAAINFVESDGHALFIIGSTAWSIPCPSDGNEFIDSSTCKFLARIAVRQFFNHTGLGTRATLYADSVVPGPVPGTGINSPYCSNQAIPLITTDHPHGIKNPETRNIYLSKDEKGNTLPRSWTGLWDEWWTYRTNLQNAYYQNVRATASRYYGLGISHGNPDNGIIGALEGDVNVLFTMDENGMKNYSDSSSVSPVCPVLGNHPQVWTRKMGRGLTAFNAMGHDENEVTPAGSNGFYTQQDSAPIKIDWRIMRYLAGDFSGCMDPSYKEYNPEATVTLLSGRDSAMARDSVAKYPKYPCKTVTTGIRVMKNYSSRIAASLQAIRISIHEPGMYRILVTDVKGKQVFAKTVSGGLNKEVEVPGLRTGTYFVRVHTPKSGQFVKRISLY